jgi:uncharacterized protein (TIGR03792 family)
MVVEELELAVAAEDVAGYVEADERVWTAFLRTCPGFVRKEVWVPVERPGVVLVQIWWRSYEEWKSITPEQVAEVDARMGEWYRDAICRERLVAWPSDG